MESVGEMLRRIREEEGLSINEISERTRIRTEYLEALEEDRHEVFPARTYVVGFLRLYAKALDIAEEDVLRSFREDRGEVRGDSERLWRDTGARKVKKGLPVSLLIVLALLISVIVVVFFLYLK